MSATVSPGQLAIYTALTTFIKGLIDCELVQGLGNNVSTPVNPFIAMTAVAQNRIATNIETYDGVSVRHVQQSVEYAVQIDCYGPDASDWAMVLSTMLRDPYGCTVLGPDVQPLYAEDPRMLPVIDAEALFEARWMVNAMLQFNPIVTVPQDYADVLNLELVSVDATFKP